MSGKQNEQMYGVLELADRWGVSKMTVYREIERGVLGALRVGRTFRVSESALRAYELGASTQRKSG